MSENNITSALVLFTNKLPAQSESWWQQFAVVVAPQEVKLSIEGKGLKFSALEELSTPGSIYEASTLVEELSRLTLADGKLLAKSFLYQGYELWWMYYHSLFIYFCLPYTQYRKLLDYLTGFDKVQFYHPPYKALFAYYLEAHGRTYKELKDRGPKSPAFLPFGILVQIILTLLSLPVLAIVRWPIMVFIGDKFEAGQDYDFRMKFIYQELRQRHLPFVEFIRSLESWKKVLHHFFMVRRRPVIYSEAISFLGHFIGALLGGRARVKRQLLSEMMRFEKDSIKLFKFRVASHYLQDVHSDIWSIRIMKLILRVISVKSAFIAATTERSFHSFLACKLNAIPTTGILHGFASRSYNSYDFMPGFNGEKSLSVDKYGVWSGWWREYYIKYSKAYQPEQIYVSGLMRPLEKKNLGRLISSEPSKNDRRVKVLLVPGELSNPKEVLPYLSALMESGEISLYLTFRPYRDSFENWLKENNPQIIQKLAQEEKILLGNIHDAISQCDVVVGSYSTGALEALQQIKPVIFFDTGKWGDYFELRNYGVNHPFFAHNSNELIERIMNAPNISQGVLKDLLERYFGDPYQNGAKWVVDQLEEPLPKGKRTK